MRVPTARVRASPRGSWCSSSVTELPTFKALTLLIDPCGLWHDEQDILPSRTGMWATARSVLTTCGRWQVGTQLRFGRLDELVLEGGRLVDAVARRARQVPAPRACCPPTPHAIRGCGSDRHVWLTSAGFIAPNFRMCPLASSSTCAWPGPWQLSQPLAAAGDRGLLARPCGVPLRVALLLGVASTHTSLPA